MRIVLFYHSILSCWNHGNVHFLRGVARELVRLGHEVAVYEPEDGWSRTNALADGGAAALRQAAALIPGITIRRYDESLDLSAATERADLIIVHEWNPPELVAALGRQRAAGCRFVLLFHDTHHRMVSARNELEAFELDGYDGVLAFGAALQHRYELAGWGRRVFTWHEAADTSLFHPQGDGHKDTDLIWIGNWGDEERTRELNTFLVNPATRLRFRTRIHGVRYPLSAQRMLRERNIDFAGWLPNHHVPHAYARSRATVHVPRRPYVESLPGIPTIRVFEALACGIPLVCAPWSDCEGLFPQGSYLSARDEDEMTEALRLIVDDAALTANLVATGLHAIHERHSCAHRVQELFDIVDRIRGAPRQSTRGFTGTQVAAS